MRDAFAEIERARSALWSLDPGCNAGEHFRLAAAFANGGGDFEEFNRWSERAHNYGSEGECRSVWKSASKPGSVTVATLFAAARAAGWTDGDEAPAKRPQSHQGKRQRPEASSTPPLHAPRTVWDACKPATIEQDYIERKRGLPDSLRTYDGPLTIAGNACAGSLVLPCSTLAGELVTLQFITPQGKKLFLPGCKLSPWPDACLIIGGPLKPDGAAYIVEGPGQAWSAHQATRAPAVVAFGVGRMAGIARALRQHYQAARLVVVPDVGKESQAAAIAKDVHGVWVELPRDLGQNGDLNDLHQRDGLPAVAALLERAKAHPQRFRLLTPDDLAALPPVRWRVRGVLPLEGIGAVFGPSGSGKSFLVLSLLAAVASGAEWFGCRVVRAPVLYVALEGEAGIPQRWKAYQAKHGRIADGLHFLLRTLDIRNATDRADLVQAVRAAGWNGGVLCLDTLNRAAPGMDENDSKSMGEAIGAAKAIQAELGGLVLLVHHTGKDATRGLRGHSSLHAALDAAIEVTRNNDRREWTVAKSKDGEDGAARPFRLDVVEIGEDEDGEPVTSCVVVPDENAGDAVRRVQIPKGGNARLVWDGLREMFKAACDRRPAGVPDELPIGRPVLSLEDAIAGTKGRLTCDSDQRGYRARLAITSLVNSGLLTLREGWLWIS